MQRASRSAGVVGLLAFEVAAVVGFERVGRVTGFALPHHDVVPWLLHASTEDLIAVATRLLGLGLAWWLLAATALSIARRVVPGWRRVRALDLVTPAAVRRVLDRALVVGVGVSLGVTSLQSVGIAGAATARRRVDTPVVRSTPSRPSTPRAGPPALTSRPRPAPGPALGTQRVVIVRAGDNLWAIARRRLRATDAATIEPYWRRVIEVNAPNLRSRDPNLIFPGERIVLPPPPG